ncbi:hypothetical protein JTF08_13590 [Micrococcaceae bacterium RIT802]|nr:hypothetical protein [Micrococcaceae bacterium RIT 802]
MSTLVKVCSVDGCDREAKGGRGFCGLHYQRFRKHGDPLVIKQRGPTAGFRAEKVPVPCSVDGCERDVEARGFCPLHYGRFRRHGDPLVVKPKGRPSKADRAARLQLEAKPPTPVAKPSECVFEALWPITGMHAAVEPTPSEARGLCELAMFDIPRLAWEAGAELAGSPRFKIILTSSNRRAKDHPQAAGCPYTLRALAPAVRRAGRAAA